MNKIGTLDIIKAYLGNKELSANNAYIGEIPLIKGSGPIPVPVPNDEIWYTSTDGNIVTPYSVDALPSIVSNTYVDGKGIIKFATDVTSIGQQAFSNCDTLKSVSFPYSLITIDKEAFKQCPNIDTIKFGPNISTIGDYAFQQSPLTALFISDLAKWCNIHKGSQSWTNVSMQLYVNNVMTTNLVIPNSVTSIGSSAFDGCSGLTSVTIPDSVTSIGDSAFYGCSGLTSVTIPDSITSIGNLVFGQCSSLTSVTIPNSVTNIGNYAFQNCSGLTSVTIPNSVTSIGSQAFYGCVSLPVDNNLIYGNVDYKVLVSINTSEKTIFTIREETELIASEIFTNKNTEKIIFNKLYSTYTNKIFKSPITNTTYTFNVEFNISEIPTDYNISTMLPQITEKKGTITYNIYTDYEPCKVQALALANPKTIVNVYHIDGTSWT